MNASNEMLQSPIVINRLSLFLRVSGLILFIGTVTLAARLIWEQTVWTWERGPQMIGYSPGPWLWCHSAVVPVCANSVDACSRGFDRTKSFEEETNREDKMGRLGTCRITLRCDGVARWILAEGIHLSNGRVTARW